MRQIIDLWNSLNARRRAVIIASAVAVFGAVLLLAHMASQPRLALLYAGLESRAAGEVVAALEQRGVAYDVRNGSIFVDAAQRDELRMTLASDGLPANSTKGYELLDGLSGFGTTSQMFDAAYWRAKEGELARTIASRPEITAARVHIASTGTTPFRRDVEPTASVAITTRPGGIAPAHARALRFLVASAVTGLSPAGVSVIDSRGGLVDGNEKTPVDAPPERAETLRQRAQRLLEARVGRGNAVVEVSIDTVTRSESIRERRIDPESRVAISTETQERTDAASNSGRDGVTVASNLPDGEAAETGKSSEEASETRERVNYEVSQTEREINVAPGAIKRLTVAVLVNGTYQADDTGAETFQPRSEEELADLKDLVASAVGLDESRGDDISIKTMQFDSAEPAGTGFEPGLLDRLPLDLMSLVQAVLLALVAVILGVFVLRPLLLRPVDDSVTPRLPGNLDPDPEPTPPAAATAAAPPLTGEINGDDFPGNGLHVVSDYDAEEPQNSGLPTLSQDEPDPVQRLRHMIGERQDETIEILRSWLEGDEEKA